MKKFSCPSCGAEVIFRSASFLYNKCSFCQSMLVRRDLDVELVGKVAELQTDPSVLQLGTGGAFEKKSFELIGRVVRKWSDGLWNEWAAMYFDGSWGWLAEAQGFYMMSFETKLNAAPPSKNSLSAGASLSLNGISFRIDDIKENTCSYMEGELPFKAQLGSQSLSVDLLGPNEQFACLEYTGSETKFFTGKYLEFDSFQFTNLKEIDGW